QSFNVVSDTQLVATSPAGSGTANVQVTTTGGFSAAGSGTQFSYQVPAISSVTPRTGIAGALVTITGSNFPTAPGATAVTFGGTAATAVACTTSSQCTVHAPAGHGQAQVTVSTSNGTSRDA